MINHDFSKKSFECAGLDTDQSKKLAEQLSQEIQKALHLVVAEELDNIVKTLNQMGHNLNLYEPPKPGDICYRDDNDENETDNYQCFLRIAVDTIISTGYSHLYKFDNEIIENDG